MDSTSFSSKTMVETTSTASETYTTSSINSKDSIVSTGPESSSTTVKTGTTSSSDNESKSASSTKSERSAGATSSSTGRRGKEDPAITDTTSGSEITSFTSSTSRGRFKLPVITSEFTTTITKPGSITTYTNEVTIHVPSTFTSTGKTTIPGTQGVTTYTDVRTTSVPRTITRSGVTSFAHVTIIPVKPTITSIQTINHEPTVSEVVETSFEPTEITYTSTSAFTVPPRTSDVTSVIVSAVPSTVASVVTSTSPPQVYVSVGTTEITKFITVPGGNRGNEPQTQPPVFQVITSVYDGKVETFVDKGTPQTMVKSDGGVYTVAFTPPPQTIVTHEGGQATQMVITVTPSPEVAFVAVPTTKDGLHANPWSIAGISSLSRNADIRSHQIDFKASAKAMREKRYGFGYFENNLGRDEYGIIYCDDSAQSLQGATASGAIPADDELTGTYQRDIAKKSRKPVPFIALTWWWRLGFIFFLTALFIIILYYHLTLGVRTSFKDFMDSQTFGVRFFFAALGVTIIFCWESIFISIAIISPYHNMGRRSQPPEKSILLTRPTNGFYGLYAAILEGNIILMLAAFMSILAEFLPILFANVPYNLTQTLKSHNVCATISLTILALMLASMVASLFIKWPELPVDPRSIAGALYYVAESRMLEDFEGLSKLDSEEREKKVKELGRRGVIKRMTSIEEPCYQNPHGLERRSRVPKDSGDASSRKALTT
ncbi:hypothetical protein K4K49_004057 [Colletotrichum sp. SAR 10_70]|nr:hypothetical protein K4K50_007367 [Colletotrichum sp. SAR 10_71]KAI8171643.1 hypothetical protein K4K49_004057 [Colletotrichum sp. SAR 10_70]KAI8181923.1 hypothetical protein K4K51_001401 [Colletotrichum sp. SAR 10_75]KAI8247147.1 hypothetical protein K4K53_002129 [Colletotrichum sp. SAR 10_77]